VYQAKDVMNEALVSVSPDTTIDEAIHILLDKKISGAPVLDQQGALVGILSEFQLLEVIYAPEIKARRVRDLMTKDVLTVQEEAGLADIVSLFILHRIRRIPVLRGTQLVGMITRSDILRYAADRPATAAPAP
jgi:CBS domain-containing protein